MSLTAEQRAYQRDWYDKNIESRRAAARAYARKWRAANPERAKELNKKYRAKTSEARRDYQLRKSYGITLAERDDLLALQGNCCAVCRAKEVKKWHVDHCHATGKVRGVLCGHCNLMIGHARDNAETLLSAAEYLKR